MGIQKITTHRFLQFLPEVIVFLLELPGVGNSLYRQTTNRNQDMMQNCLISF